MDTENRCTIGFTNRETLGVLETAEEARDAILNPSFVTDHGTFAALAFRSGDSHFNIYVNPTAVVYIMDHDPSV